MEDPKLEGSSSSSGEMPEKLDNVETAAKPDTVVTSEWNVKSSLQVLGGFLLFFNSFGLDLRTH